MPISPKIVKTIVDTAKKATAKALERQKTEYELAHELAQKRAALPVEEGGLGLPPDNTAMDRARALGFDVDNIEYHTTDVKKIPSIYEHGFVNMDTGERNFKHLGKEYGGDRYYATGQGNYTSSSPFASWFTAQGKLGTDQAMLPLVINKSKHFDFKNPTHIQDLMTPRESYQEILGKAEMNPKDLKALQEGKHYLMEDWITLMNLKKRGYTGTNLIEPQQYYAGEGVTTNTFKPSNIRSVNAAFDPFRRNEADILAGLMALPAIELLGDDKKPSKSDKKKVKGYKEGGEVDLEAEFRKADMIAPQHFGEGGEADKPVLKGETAKPSLKEELDNYIQQDNLNTLLQELARRIQLSGEASSSREGSQAFGRLGYRQPIGDDMSVGVGARGHYFKGDGFKDADVDRADMSLSKRFKDASELRARLGANLNEQMGKRGLDELMLEYEIPFKDGGKAKKKSKGYGERIDGTEKERGFLGEIRLPDGRDVMTEVSVGMPNTDELFRPSIIRGMHPADLNYLRETGLVPEDLYQASLLHAQKRIKEGKSPFWNAKEDAEPQHFGLGGLAKGIKKIADTAKKVTAKDNLSKYMQGSKAVDEAGNPKVYYHGTTAKDDFSEFSPASFFTDSPKEASAYTMYKDLERKEKALKKYSLSNDVSNAGSYVPYTGTLSDIVDPQVGALYATDNGAYRYLGDGRWEGMSKLDVDYNKYDPKTDSMMLKKVKKGQAVDTVREHKQWAHNTFTEGEGGRVYPVYLDIKNPVELSALEANVLGKRLGADDKLVQEFIDKYAKQGYDAIVTKSDEAAYFPEVRESLGGIPTQYIPFRPEQIKSAVGNVGTYDPNAKDILKANGGEVQSYGVGGLAKGANKIKEVTKKVLESKGKYGAERVEKAADLVPNLEKQYDAEALYRAFIGDGDNAAGLMVMSPKSFESYSQPLWEEFIEPQYIHELSQIARQKGFKDVPFLMLGRKESEYLPRELQELYIAGHEGRHRTRALDKLGDESTLIRMIPRSSMREHLPRRSQEEYIDALNKELGLNPLVRPEQDTEEIRRLIRLPEIFAKGGEVKGYKEGGDLEEEFRKADMIDMSGFRQDPLEKATRRADNKPKKQSSMSELNKRLNIAKEVGTELLDEFKKSSAKEAKAIAKSPKGVGDLLRNIAGDYAAMIEGSPIIPTLTGSSQNELAKLALTAMKGKKALEQEYANRKPSDLMGKELSAYGMENMEDGMLRKAIMGDAESMPISSTVLGLASPFAGKAVVKGAKAIAPDVMRAIEKATVDPYTMRMVEDTGVFNQNTGTVNFVSAVERTIKGHKMESMNGEQWANWMRANASKSAKKEAEATGLYDWLKTQGKVSKGDIEQYVELNLPKIQKTEYGFGSRKLTPEQEERLAILEHENAKMPLGAIDDIYGEGTYDELIQLQNIRDKATTEKLYQLQPELERKANIAQQRGDKELAKKYWDEINHITARVEHLELKDAVNKPRFERFKEPGGENYREVTISLPKPMKEYNQFIDKIKEKYGEGPLDSLPLTAAEKRTLENLYAKEERGLYRVPESHTYGDDISDINRLLHYRANERLTPEGKKVSFLEELQADWAQQGRKYGFKSEKQKELAELQAQLDAVSSRKKELEELAKPYTEQGKDAPSNILDAWNQAANYERILTDKIARTADQGLPEAPYVTDTGDWTKLGLKHALKDAIDQGHDYLAWTTGEQQAARYDLSKQVGAINFYEHPEGSNRFVIKDINGDEIVNEQNIKPERLEEFVGKEYAEKLMNQEPRKYFRSSSQQEPSYYRELTNENLRIGGEGMKGYYDKIVPQSARDILKEYGIKDGVKEIPINYGESPPIPKNLSADDLLAQYGRELAPDQRQYLERYVDRWDLQSEMGDTEDLISEYKNWLDLQDFSPKPIATGTHIGIEITPELKEKILNEGLTHFKRGGKVNPLDLETQFRLASILARH